MYLSGSKWSMRKKHRRPSNPWRIIILLLLIAGGVYFERAIVPTVPPLFVPTMTPTRSPAAIILEGESLFQAGKLSQAESAYQQAITVDPTQITYYIDLARIQALEGKLTDAETSARNALLIDSNSAQAAAMLAWVLDLESLQATDTQTQLKLLDEARASIDRALKQNPGSALVHAINAQVLVDEYTIANEDTIQQASDEARKAISIDPGSLDAQYALGVVMETTSNYPQALEAYQTASRINGNLGLLAIKVGDMYFAEAISGTGDTSSTDLINSAIASYIHATQLSPTDTTPLRRIVQAYARVGQYARASQYAEDAVRLSPDDPYLHGLYGQMLRKNNQTQQGVVELGYAIRGGRIPGVWTVNDQAIEITDQTKIGGQFNVGDQVRIDTIQGSDGNLQAATISSALSTAVPTPAGTSDSEVVGQLQAVQQPVTIKGIRLDEGAKAIELYYTYALALSETGQCDLAVQVSQAILLGVQNDDTARFNAEQALTNCGAAQGTGTPAPTVTATP